MDRDRRPTIVYTYLITIATDLRRPLFRQPDLARIVAESMAFFDTKRLVDSFAWVVMPDRIHWVFRLQRSDLPTIVRRLKNWTGREINRALGTEDRPVWRRGYRDRYLTRAELVDKAVHYVRMNPVVAGLVQLPEDYPFLHVAGISRSAAIT